MIMIISIRPSVSVQLNLLNPFPTASLGATLLVLFFLGIDLY